MEHSVSENGIHAARMGNGAGEARDLSRDRDATAPATPQSSGTSQSNTPRQGHQGVLTPKGLRQNPSSYNFLKAWNQQNLHKGQEGDGDSEDDMGRAMRQSIEAAADVVAHFFRTGRVPERVQSLPTAGPPQRAVGAAAFRPREDAIDGQCQH